MMLWFLVFSNRVAEEATFRERKIVNLNTSYGGIPLILSIGKKVPCDLNLYINWQIAGYKYSGCQSSH